ncbi:MAG: DUF4126 domain-containing protein [Pseudomonadota bacterium]
MEHETIQAIALMLGASWASGINLYAAILVLGILGNSGYADLPEGMALVENPLVIGVAAIMYFIEFFADKTPGVDSGWDAIHTFIRIPAGAMMAVGAVEGLEVNQAVDLAAALLGGGVAATSHFTKAGSRLMINTSPEPVTNWVASISEDLAVIGGLWAALTYPWLFIALLIAFILLAIWLLPKIWRALKLVVRKIGNWFSSDEGATTADATASERKVGIDAMEGSSRELPKQ